MTNTTSTLLISNSITIKGTTFTLQMSYITTKGDVKTEIEFNDKRYEEYLTDYFNGKRDDDKVIKRQLDKDIYHFTTQIFNGKLEDDAYSAYANDIKLKMINSLQTYLINTII